MTSEARHCWVCDAAGLTLRKPADVSTLTAADFAISDARYGRTAAIFECNTCGFLQCAELSEVVPFYTDLEDTEYEASRPGRRLQARRLLRYLRRHLGRDLRGLRLLDVGAGSGPLVEEALTLGIDCHGVEPSRWLSARAAERGLPVHHGVLPQPGLGAFDVVSLIDVIEHAPDPTRLLREAVAVTRPGGVVVLVTPDVQSVVARMMGWRWWHFRVAHVGYFSRETLERLCRRAGLTPVAALRPSWVLPLGYLLERVAQYLPGWIRLPRAQWMASMAVPFNLYDSVMLFARRPDDPAPAAARDPAVS